MRHIIGILSCGDSGRGARHTGRDHRHHGGLCRCRADLQHRRGEWSIFLHVDAAGGMDWFFHRHIHQRNAEQHEWHAQRRSGQRLRHVHTEQPGNRGGNDARTARHHQRSGECVQYYSADIHGDGRRWRNQLYLDATGWLERHINDGIHHGDAWRYWWKHHRDSGKCLRYIFSKHDGGERRHYAACTWRHDWPGDTLSWRYADLQRVSCRRRKCVHLDTPCGMERQQHRGEHFGDGGQHRWNHFRNCNNELRYLGSGFASGKRFIRRTGSTGRYHWSDNGMYRCRANLFCGTGRGRSFVRLDASSGMDRNIEHRQHHGYAIGHRRHHLGDRHQ